MIVDLTFFGGRNLLHANYNLSDYTQILTAVCITYCYYNLVDIGFSCAKEYLGSVKTLEISVKDSVDKSVG